MRWTIFLMKMVWRGKELGGRGDDDYLGGIHHMYFFWANVLLISCWYCAEAHGKQGIFFRKVDLPLRQGRHTY